MKKMNDSAKGPATDMPSAEQLFSRLHPVSEFTGRPGIGHQLETDVSNSSGVVTAFRDSSGAIGLFIPFGADDTAAFRPDIRSEHITLRKVTRRNANVAQLMLENLIFRNVFEVFVDTFLEEAAASPEAAVTIVADQLSRWRSLFSSVPKSQMSEEKEIGLLCELQTMSELLETDGSLAFFRWTGPDRQAHDFRFDDRAIECKATRSSTGLNITIHGVNQLTPESNGRLLLVVRRYELTPTGDLSLSSIVNSLAADPRVNSVEFYRKVRSEGFSLENEESVEERRYRLRETHVFEVHDDFPRITVTGLQSRIGALSYTLDLNPPSEIPGYLEAGQLN